MSGVEEEVEGFQTVHQVIEHVMTPEVIFAIWAIMIFYLFRSLRASTDTSEADIDTGDLPYVAKQDGTANENGHVKFISTRLKNDQQLSRSKEFHQILNMRRSVRFFSDEPVSSKVLENCIKAAGTAPSGAHQQPWHFVVVTNKALKTQIRNSVEKQEQINYSRRMKESWVKDVAGILSDLHDAKAPTKPYLSEAPALVCVFKKTHELSETGQKSPIYYAQQGIHIHIFLYIYIYTSHGMCLCVCIYIYVSCLVE